MRSINIQVGHTELTKHTLLQLIKRCALKQNKNIARSKLIRFYASQADKSATLVARQCAPSSRPVRDLEETEEWKA